MIKIELQTSLKDQSCPSLVFISNIHHTTFLGDHGLTTEYTGTVQNNNGVLHRLSVLDNNMVILDVRRQKKVVTVRCCDGRGLTCGRQQRMSPPLL